MHNRQARPATPPPDWLDHEQRRLIAPLALWDITDQLRDAAELFRLRAKP